MLLASYPPAQTLNLGLRVWGGFWTYGSAIGSPVRRDVESLPVGFLCHTISAGDESRVLASGEVLQLELRHPLLRNTEYVATGTKGWCGSSFGEGVFFFLRGTLLFVCLFFFLGGGPLKMRCPEGASDCPFGLGGWGMQS